MGRGGEGGGGVGHIGLFWMNDEVAVCGWQTDCIARIDPISGRVKAWLYLATLRCISNASQHESNFSFGIYHLACAARSEGRLFVFRCCLVFTRTSEFLVLVSVFEYFFGQQ